MCQWILLRGKCFFLHSSRNKWHLPEWQSNQRPGRTKHVTSTHFNNHMKWWTIQFIIFNLAVNSVKKKKKKNVIFLLRIYTCFFWEWWCATAWQSDCDGLHIQNWWCFWWPFPHSEEKRRLYVTMRKNSCEGMTAGTLQQWELLTTLSSSHFPGIS